MTSAAQGPAETTVRPAETAVNNNKGCVHWFKGHTRTVSVVALATTTLVVALLGATIAVLAATGQLGGLVQFANYAWQMPAVKVGMIVGACVVATGLVALTGMVVSNSCKAKKTPPNNASTTTDAAAVQSQVSSTAPSSSSSSDQSKPSMPQSSSSGEDRYKGFLGGVRKKWNALTGRQPQTQQSSTTPPKPQQPPQSSASTAKPQQQSSAPTAKPQQQPQPSASTAKPQPQPSASTAQPPVATGAAQPPAATRAAQPPVATGAAQPPAATRAAQPPAATRAAQPPVATRAAQPQQPPQSSAPPAKPLPTPPVKSSSPSSTSIGGGAPLPALQHAEQETTSTTNPPHQGVAPTPPLLSDSMLTSSCSKLPDAEGPVPPTTSKPLPLPKEKEDSEVTKKEKQTLPADPSAFKPSAVALQGNSSSSEQQSQPAAPVEQQGSELTLKNDSQVTKKEVQTLPSDTQPVVSEEKNEFEDFKKLFDDEGTSGTASSSAPQEKPTAAGEEQDLMKTPVKSSKPSTLTGGSRLPAGQPTAPAISSVVKSEGTAPTSSPIHDVVSGGTIEELEELLKTDSSSINDLNSDKETPFQVAAFYGRTEMMKLLHSTGAELEKTGMLGRTAAHYAVWGKHAETVIPLLEKMSANLYAQDNLQKSPLHKAVADGKPCAVTALRKAGVSDTVKDKWGKLAIDLVKVPKGDTVKFALVKALTEDVDKNELEEEDFSQEPDGVSSLLRSPESRNKGDEQCEEF